MRTSSLEIYRYVDFITTRKSLVGMQLAQSSKLNLSSSSEHQIVFRIRVHLPRKQNGSVFLDFDVCRHESIEARTNNCPALD